MNGGNRQVRCICAGPRRECEGNNDRSGQGLRWLNHRKRRYVLQNSESLSGGFRIASEASSITTSEITKSKSGMALFHHVFVSV